MEKIAKIVNAPDYVRDMESGAVVLNNKKQLDKYLVEKQKKLEEKRKMVALEEEVVALKAELGELSLIVKQLQVTCLGK